MIKERQNFEGAIIRLQGGKSKGPLIHPVSGTLETYELSNGSIEHVARLNIQIGDIRRYLWDEEELDKLVIGNSLYQIEYMAKGLKANLGFRVTPLGGEKI